MSPGIDPRIGPLVVETIGWTILHSLWQGCLVAAAAAVALRLLDRSTPAARYAVAYGSLVALLALPALTVWSAGPTAGGPGGAWFAWLPAGAWQAGVSILHGWLPVVTTVWCAGVGLLSLRFVQGWRVLGRLCTDGHRAVPAAVEARVRRLAGHIGIGRKVRIIESTMAEVVCVVGWTRPMILFPASVLTGLPPSHLDAILAHELAHIRRHDFAMNVAQMALETLLFYHPAAWWLSRRVRQEREHCCDRIAAAVCGDRVEYARGLTALECLRAPGSEAIVAMSGDGTLLRRVRRITTDAPAPSRGRHVAAALVLGAGVLAAAGGATLWPEPAWAAGGAPVAAAPLALGALLGLLIGLRHAVEPDHLVTVATLVTGQRSAGDAARIGATWGLGHTAALAAIGFVLVLAQRTLPLEVSRFFEVGVAVVLILVGIRAVRLGRRLATEGPAVEHTHGTRRHRHPGPAAHVHVGSWTFARQPLVVGLIHGVAGSGSVTALMVASLPSTGARLAFLALFAVASTTAMAVLAGCCGWSGGRLASGPRARASLSMATGIVSMLLGAAWAYPLLAP